MGEEQRPCSDSWIEFRARSEIPARFKKILPRSASIERWVCWLMFSGVRQGEQRANHLAEPRTIPRANRSKSKYLAAVSLIEFWSTSRRSWVCRLISSKLFPKIEL